MLYLFSNIFDYCLWKSSWSHYFLSIHFYLFITVLLYFKVSNVDIYTDENESNFKMSAHPDAYTFSFFF